MIKKINLILLIVLFPLLGVTQELPGLFSSEIDSLNKYGKAIIESSTDEQKAAANTKFKAVLEEVLTNNASFDADFSEVEKISVLKANQLKIYNWTLPHTDGTYTYFAFIQFKTADEKVIVTELIDKSAELDKLETKTFTANTWFGALYYEIIHDKKIGEDYYTVLGWDGNNLMTNKKVIDVIVVDNKGNIKLGAPIFKMEKRTQRRVIFEYSKNASMSLKYHPKQKQIIFDFLVPSSSRVKGIYEYYGPALDTFDALTMKKRKWHFESHIKIHNEKNQNDKKWGNPFKENKKKPKEGIY
ncbi:MAG: hypothetical protein RQ875_03225 [Vicingaceae bacterium]|nr:hypothetical protein [Vicingaceae bacterium]